MKTSNRLSRRVALALASTLLAGLGLEIALRLLGAGPVAVNPDQRDFWVYHPQLGWSLRAGQEGSFDNGHFRVHVAINSLGLRGPEIALQKPEGVRRVLVIGDSFAWGFGVEQAEIFGTRLEAAHSNIEVINGAVPGFSTDQALLWLHSAGKTFAPDVVVYVLSGNDDIMNHMQVAYWTYYKPSFRLNPDGVLQLQGVPVPRSSFGARLRHGLRSRSAIVRAIETAVLGGEASFVYLADGRPDPEDPHRLSVALVDAMRDEATNLDASFVVVASSQFWFSPAGSHERLIAELRAAGHPVIDVASEPGWQGDDMQIPGDGHWNALGHAFVAGLLGEWLEANPR